MRVDELADGGIDGRPRTQELSSSLKAIPYIDHSFQDWHGFTAELNNFLALGNYNLDAIPADEHGSYLEHCKWILEDMTHGLRRPEEKTDASATADDYGELLLVFINLCHEEPGAIAAEDIAAIAEKIASFRWTELDSPFVGLYFSLMRAALYRKYGRATAEICVSPSPADYEAFRQNVLMRYPSAVLPPSQNLPLSVHNVFEPPKRTIQPLLMSEIPASIKEACDLYQSRVCTTPGFTQLWDQHEEYGRKWRRGTYDADTADKDNENGASESYNRLYGLMLPFAKSFYIVFVNYLLKRGTMHEELAGVRAALGVVNSLVHSTNHILEQQYILTMLFDLQYHLVAFKYFAYNPVLETVLQPNTEGWLPTANPKRHTRAQSTTDGIKIEQFNITALEILVLLTRLLRQTIEGRPQRITIIAELPNDALKQLMSLYNDDLWTEVLTIFKFQAPLNGKKWRCMNMEIISAIYMHCPFRLDDDWLTGGDAVSDVRPPALPEDLLRELIDMYNRDHELENEVRSLHLESR